MTKEYIYDFHRYEGEGGEGGLGAEASAFAASIGMEMPKQDKTEPANKPQGKENPSQVGTDNGGKSLEAEFAELTGKGGKFEKLFGKSISDAVKDRFKNQADLQGQVDQMNEAIAPLRQIYGLEDGDIEGLKNRIAGDESLYQAGAEEAGLSVEQYRNNLKLQADAERGRRIEAAYEEQQKENAMYEQWAGEEEALKSVVPNFDLASEIKANESFARLIHNGVSVQDAFMATHASEIFNGFNQETTRQAQADVISAIQQRATRPPENGLSHNPATQRKSDPNSLTSEDIDAIFRGVEEGKSYHF